ncbi:two-component system sensor histidine kinase MprB [Tamaricihabitans halophyticus]|uniref:histidine kinase n=1 Tax=Tamaricihabitans halophyticus TaxID=1262583 RepID=A0A4R2QUT0_9PSEU|nr:HAMP domain-containing sensor histidine kinase [Tamaricihabitans halophyticus]TCP53014.1 two-component system sensor histidine kinase MprB [Tamaricihabitans halophyticus]
MSEASTQTAPGIGQQLRFSLRRRVTLLATLCVACAVALVSAAAFVTVQTNLYQQLDDTLERRAQNALQDRTMAQSQTQRFPAAFLSLTDTEFALIDPGGQSAVDVGQSVPPIGNEERLVAAGADDHSLRTDTRSDTRVLAVAYEDGLALVVAQPLGPTRTALGKLAIVLVLVGGAGIILATLAGMAVARGGLRPVQRLNQATEHVARTGELRPIPVTGDDELARLTQSFNTMLGALAESRARQQQLVADAGHELRTPLTSLRTNIELLVAAQAADSPRLSDADRAELDADVRGQLDELTQLIGDLVELAREDAPRAEFERLELAEVVERALDRARRRAGDVRFEVTLHPWSLNGDSSVLERAVLNLLDNAVKFSPPGSVVRVGLTPTGPGSARLDVADSGPGVAEADRPWVFDRFYRSSEARTMPGSGLGLAIVQLAARRHGGTVQVGSAEDGGALFTLWLPGAPS